MRACLPTKEKGGMGSFLKIPGKPFLNILQKKNPAKNINTQGKTGK